MSRISRTSEEKRDRSVAVTVLASLLIGLFAAMGVNPLLSTLAFILPSQEVPVKIVGRDQHVTSFIVPSGFSSNSLGFRTIVEFEDGTRRTLACREDLYRQSLDGLRGRDTVKLKQSQLAGRPLSLSIASKPLFSLHGVEATARTRIHSLTMPLSGILISALFCWGIVIYLMLKLRKNPALHHKLSYSILGFCVVLGLVWWAYSV